MKKRFGLLSLFGATALLLALVGGITALAAPSSAVGTVKWDRAWTNLDQLLKLTVTDTDLNTSVLQQNEAHTLADDPFGPAIGVGTLYSIPLAQAPVLDWVKLTPTNLYNFIGDKDGVVDAGENVAFTTAMGVAAFAGTKPTQAELDINGLNLAGAEQRDDGNVTSKDVIIILNAADATAGLALTVESVNALEGRASVRVTATGGLTAATADFNLTYFAAVTETTTVTVTSLSDPAGFTITLEETARNTGVFEATMNLNIAAATNTQAALDDPAVGPRPIIKAADGDVITFSYTDVSESKAKRKATVSVELTKPTLSNLDPANKKFVKTKVVTLNVDVTDALSGVKDSTIQFYVCQQSNDCAVGANFALVADSDDVLDDDQTTGFGFDTNKYTLTNVTGGKRASVKLELLDGDGDYEWYAKSNDNAGNEGLTKGDPDAVGDGAANSAIIKLDTTGLGLGTDAWSAGASAVTGQWWDATKTDVVATAKDERLIDDPAKAKNTSLRVVFDTPIDGTSVAKEDFKVNDAAPTAAEFFAKKSDSVFLTVAALSPGSKPKVEVVAGGVLDAAGNPNTTVLPAPPEILTAIDGIAPTLTVMLAGDAGITGVSVSAKSVTSTMTTNETLLGVPAIKVAKVVKVNNVLVADGVLADAGAVSFVKTDTWERKLTSDALLPLGGASLFVAEVTGNDSANNTGKAGGIDPTSKTALLFELDTKLDAPIITPADDADVFRTDPFITVNWTGEGTEYDGDSHKKVTITSATLDGVDQLANVATTDNATFILATSGLALGEHIFTVNGTDEVGNKRLADEKVTFTVKEVAKVSIALKPGQNLVSLPGEPGDSAINSVITGSEVSSVITYDPINLDPTTGSPWRTATRDAAGNLAGSLTTIDAQHAYWVKTTSFDPIKVEIPDQGFAALPPSIQVVAGWNLVPVVSIAGNPPLPAGKTCATNADSCISADTYLGSTKWVTAYTFDPQLNQWTKLLPRNFDKVQIGSGYWVYVTEDGILVP